MPGGFAGTREAGRLRGGAAGEAQGPARQGRPVLDLVVLVAVAAAQVDDGQEFRKAPFRGGTCRYKRRVLRRPEGDAGPRAGRREDRLRVRRRAHVLGEVRRGGEGLPPCARDVFRGQSQGCVQDRAERIPHCRGVVCAGLQVRSKRPAQDACRQKARHKQARRRGLERLRESVVRLPFWRGSVCDGAPKVDGRKGLPRAAESRIHRRLCAAFRGLGPARRRQAGRSTSGLSCAPTRGSRHKGGHWRAMPLFGHAVHRREGAGRKERRVHA